MTDPQRPPRPTDPAEGDRPGDAEPEAGRTPRAEDPAEGDRDGSGEGADTPG